MQTISMITMVNTRATPQGRGPAEVSPEGAAGVWPWAGDSSTSPSSGAAIQRVSRFMAHPGASQGFVSRGFLAEDGLYLPPQRHQRRRRRRWWRRRGRYDRLGLFFLQLRRLRLLLEQAAL